MVAVAYSNMRVFNRLFSGVSVKSDFVTLYSRGPVNLHTNVMLKKQTLHVGESVSWV